MKENSKNNNKKESKKKKRVLKTEDKYFSDQEIDFIMSYILNEKKNHASIFISKAYTTLEKFKNNNHNDNNANSDNNDSNVVDDNRGNEKEKDYGKKECLKEYFESIKDDSITNILIKATLQIKNFNLEESLKYLEELQANKDKKANEFKMSLEQNDDNFNETINENFKYKFKKALEIKVKDLNMDLVDKYTYDNLNVTKKKYDKKNKSDNDNCNKN